MDFFVVLENWTVLKFKIRIHHTVDPTQNKNQSNLIELKSSIIIFQDSKSVTFTVQLLDLIQ
jgi:hypothetical protein